MIESAATAVPADGDGAAALTESYMRANGELHAPARPGARLRRGLRLNIDEFDPAFPEIDVIEIPEHEHPRRQATRAMQYAPHAKRAPALLGQLAGWVGGLIDELTLEQRRRYETEERVKLERRQPPGFSPS